MRTIFTCIILFATFLTSAFAQKDFFLLGSYEIDNSLSLWLSSLKIGFSVGVLALLIKPFLKKSKSAFWLTAWIMTSTLLALSSLSYTPILPELSLYHLSTNSLIFACLTLLFGLHFSTVYLNFNHGSYLTIIRSIAILASASVVATSFISISLASTMMLILWGISLFGGTAVLTWFMTENYPKAKNLLYSWFPILGGIFLSLILGNSITGLSGVIQSTAILATYGAFAYLALNINGFLTQYNNQYIVEKNDDMNDTTDTQNDEQIIPQSFEENLENFFTQKQLQGAFSVWNRQTGQIILAQDTQTMLDYNNKQCDIHLFAHLIAANAVVNHNSLDNDEQTVSQQIENFFASIDFNQRHDYIYRHQEKDGATVLEINPFVNNHALIHCYFEYDEIEQEDDITYDEKEIQTINLQHIAPERVKVIERIEGLKKYINDYKGVGVIGILISNINTHPLLASEIHQRLFNTCGDECFMIAVEKDRLILVLYQLVQKNTLDSLVNDIKAALDDEFAVEGHLYKVQAVFSHYLAQNYEETSEQILDIVEQKLEDRKLPFVRFTAEILDGISNHQFILFYQPIVDIQKGVISGFEALIRWNHPDRGLLLPAEFLFDIEQAGLGKIIGRYVIARAMAQLARWQARSQNHEFFVSINLTKELMQEDDFIAMVQSIGQSLEISLKNVHFEITEHHMLENSPLICSRVVQLKQLGCGVGLDDFGTGYSSLNAIVDLPINWVKIDRELIHDIAINERKALIVQKVLELTTLLGLRTIAEGVEDFATVDILKKADCKFIQGFIFGKPLPPEKAFKLLESMNFTPPSEIVIETDKQISNSVF